MGRYDALNNALAGYFEDALMGEGANSFNAYKSVVGNDKVGPLDQEIWNLHVHLQDLMGAHGQQSAGRRKASKVRNTRKNRKNRK